MEIELQKFKSLKIYSPMSSHLSDFQKLIDVLESLLAPGGCEWDRKQTHKSLVPYLLEETHEVIEAIENGDMDSLKEELGDLMLHILFQAKLAESEGHFSVSDSLKDISSKLIRRHPHVFSDAKQPSDDNQSWEQAKKKEKKRDSVLDGVPLSLPTLTRARRIQEKASSVGFDWKAIEPIWDKVHEEIGELSEAIETQDKNKIQDEMGDALFSIVNLARFLDIDPEASLRQTIRKFESRFKKVEKSFEDSEAMSKASLEQMDKIWNQAKEEE